MSMKTRLLFPEHTVSIACRDGTFRKVEAYRIVGQCAITDSTDYVDGRTRRPLWNIVHVASGRRVLAFGRRDKRYGLREIVDLLERLQAYDLDACCDRENKETARAVLEVWRLWLQERGCWWDEVGVVT